MKNYIAKIFAPVLFSVISTGLFVMSDRYLLTNKHVVEDMEAAYVVYTGKEHIAAQVIYRDPDYDLAILKVSGNGYPVIELSDSVGLTPGDNVIAIGNALGKYSDSVSSGRIAAFDQSIVV